MDASRVAPTHPKRRAFHSERNDYHFEVEKFRAALHEARERDKRHQRGDVPNDAACGELSP
jgi:hypothetical protein